MALDKILPKDGSEVEDNTYYQLTGVSLRKINDLIDVVNALVKESNMHEIQIDELQMCVDKLGLKNGFTIVNDYYAEQRKWIGCLCKFWNYDDDKGVFDILIEVDSNYRTIPFVGYGGGSYAHCEPVRPDDDIIYKKD